MKQLKEYLENIDECIVDNNTLSETLCELNEDNESDRRRSVIIDALKEIEKEYPNIKKKVVKFGTGAKDVKYSWFDTHELKHGRKMLNGVYYVGDEYGMMTDGYNLVIAHVGEYPKEYDGKVIRFGGKEVGSLFPNIGNIKITDKKEVNFKKFVSALNDVYKNNKAAKKDDTLTKKSLILDDDAAIYYTNIDRIHSMFNVVKKGSIFVAKTYRNSPCMVVAADGLYAIIMLSLMNGEETKENSVDVREV